MTRCKNCGHESHCGVPLRKDVDRSGTEIEVCRNCSCDNCFAITGSLCLSKEIEMACDNEKCKSLDCDCDPCECTEENLCECCAE